MSSDTSGGAASPQSGPGTNPSTDGSGNSSRSDQPGHGAPRDGGRHDETDGKETSAGIRGDTGDAFDPDAREVYEAGRRVLNPGGTTVISGQAAYVTVQNIIGQAGARATSPPGPVRDDELRWLMRRYVKPRGYDDFESALRRGRLLILVGPPDSGRSTTALRLLDEVTSGKVRRLEPGSYPCTVPAEQIEKGHGYAGVLNVVEAGRAQSLADGLRQVLGQREAFCVLVAPDSTVVRSAFGAAVKPCPLPDAIEMLSEHVDAGVREEDPSGVVARANGIAESERLDAVWRSGWRPADVVGLAELLLALEHGDRTLDDVRAYPAVLLEARIAGWMSALRGMTHGEKAERARRLTAFRISCAVFDGMSRHIIERAADELAACMVQPPPPVQHQGQRRPAVPAVRPATVPILAVEDDDVLLHATGLTLDQSRARYLGVEVPSELLRFQDDRIPVALLRHVWLRHPPLRRPVAYWLDGLSRDARPTVRTRAAQAAGLLCTVDFAGTVDALIVPAASAAPRRQSGGTGTVGSPSADDADELDDLEEPWELRRHFAAVALDHAARDVVVRPAVQTLLRRWRRSEDTALRWSAARALGHDIGLYQISVTFEELRVIGTPQERSDLRKLTSRVAFEQEVDLIWVSGLSLAWLFVNGAARRVLATLDEWKRHRRQSLRDLAIQAVILLAAVKVAAVGRPDTGTPDIGAQEMLILDDVSRSRWPVLLALESTGSELVRPAADLLRTALRSPSGRVAAETLGGWLDHAQSDAAALEALEAFLPRLIVEQSDQAMLRSLIGRKRRAWADPLRSDVADRLEVVINAVPIAIRRRG